MCPNLRHRRSLGAFTLIELLVVISIIAILAGILLPALQAVSQAAKVSATQALVARLEVGAAQYQKDMLHFPPDFAPSTWGFLKYPDRLNPSGLAMPPEAVCYFLANPSVGPPYAHLSRGREMQDYNGNHLPEAVDGWGQPILYNRGRFPGRLYYEHNYAGNPPGSTSTSYEAPDGKPWHNKEGVDIYSLGPDGTTGGRDGQAGRDKPPANLGQAASNPTLFYQYVERSMKAYDYPANASHGPLCGNEDDDISNWK